MLRYTTDRARPGLVALYDIRPGNGAGQFLQPRSPHGADRQKITFPGSACPKEIPLPLLTHKQYTARESSWGLPSLSLTTEGSWIHLGGTVAKPLISPLMPVPPFNLIS